MLSSGIAPESTKGTTSSATHIYTVPAIHHVPTNTYLMDSIPIAQFIESTYPTPPVPLTSELGREIEAKARAVGGRAFVALVMPRELRILSPRAQEYFRRTREASLGHPLEDLLTSEKQEQAWKLTDEGMGAVGELMQTNKAEGPFVLGASPSMTDFFIVGSLESTRIVDEDVFKRMVEYPGRKELYEACLPYMEKRD
jgi:glutathione S-transferase